MSEQDHRRRVSTIDLSGGRSEWQCRPVLDVTRRSLHVESQWDAVYRSWPGTLDLFPHRTLRWIPECGEWPLECERQNGDCSHGPLSDQATSLVLVGLEYVGQRTERLWHLSSGRGRMDARPRD